MISFSTVEVTFRLSNKRKIRSWVKTLIETEGKSPGDITYVFCNDNYLSEMNIKYLKHKTLTDIITFDYSNKVKLSGDIFISIERVKENAVLYKATFNSELGRVMAHGVLHLVGYGDHTSEEKATMRRKEDSYLSSFPNL
jgi:probable rRNA maturation factor